jgi:ribosome-associated translation inhibitor RaiA
MSINSRIHFQNMKSSSFLETAIYKHIAKLQRFYRHILSCDVTVEAPHRHHHKGSTYKVVIKMGVPGGSLVISHTEHDDPRKADCYVAVHDAFQSARRRLQDYVRIQRHDVKRHPDSARRGAETNKSDQFDDLTGEQ